MSNGLLNGAMALVLLLATGLFVYNLYIWTDKRNVRLSSEAAADTMPLPEQGRRRR